MFAMCRLPWSLIRRQRCTNHGLVASFNPEATEREQVVSQAMTDDWMNEHAEIWPSKIRRWGRYPVADKRGELMNSAFLYQSLYEATCRLRFQPNRDSRPSLEERQPSRGSMSDWLYLIGSFCFVAGTLLNMVQR